MSAGGRIPGADGAATATKADDERFRKLIEQNADGMLLVRPDGTVVFVNPATRALFGCSDDQLIGHQFGIPISASGRTEVDVPRDGGVRIAELRVVETEWEGSPAFLASLRDITERKRLEEELRRQAEALAEADRRKDEFLAMLGHELRNPLAPILNAVHIMRLKGDDRPTLERMRDLVEQQVRHLARLVDDLLDVSRITRGKIRLSREPVDLVAVVQRAVETVHPAVDARRHTLEVTLPETAMHLEADPTRLEQVIVNLLNNAVKYTDPGGAIELSVASSGPEVTLTVRDSGIGIAPEMLPHVFDLFTQADRSLDRSQGGLGIGLTLVRQLVELHGGRIRAHSDGLGRGSTFTVTLPPLQVPVAVPASQSGCGAGPRTDGRGLHVLIVDDNVQAAESLALIVRLWGHSARTVHSGALAIEAAQAYRPDVILLDIGLPGMDGYEAARRLRAEPGFEIVLLVATTGYGRDEDRRLSAGAGFDHHLVKPLDLDELEALLNRAAARERTRPAATSDPR